MNGFIIVDVYVVYILVIFGDCVVVRWVCAWCVYVSLLLLMVWMDLLSGGFLWFGFWLLSLVMNTTSKVFGV